MKIENDPKLRIRELNSNDQSLVYDIVKTYEAGLGRGYIPQREVLKYLSGFDDKFILAALYNNELAGAYLCKPLSNDEAAEYNAVLKKARKLPFLSYHLIGLLKSITVKEEFRKKGIGTLLTQKAIDHFKDKGYDGVFALSWDPNKPWSSKKIFNKLGFKRLHRKREYWYQDSLDKGYECPIVKIPAAVQQYFFI